MIESINKAKTDAQNTISDAKSAIDRAKELIKKADDIIKSADVLGLDTLDSKANLDTSKAKLDLADNYYDEASTALSQNNFDLTLSKAQSAKSYANEAENYATSAYGPLSSKVLELNKTMGALIDAIKEINIMNDMYGKLDFIIKSTEKRGVSLEQAKNVVSNAKSDIDSAEDLLSQAKNRQQSGLVSESIQLAISARDSAAKANNRLDTISSSIKSEVETAIDKVYLELEKEVSNTESEVKSAEQTYGSDAKEVVAAKELISEAKTKLLSAKSSIDKVTAASKLEEVLTEADASLKSLDNVQEDLNNSLEKIGSAKRIRLMTIAGGIAVILAAVGGGFLYYRKRKNNPHKVYHETHETHQEETSKEKKGKHCTQCGNKLKENEKFCSSCGVKV